MVCWQYLQLDICSKLGLYMEKKENPNKKHRVDVSEYKLLIQPG